MMASNPPLIQFATNVAFAALLKVDRDLSRLSEPVRTVVLITGVQAVIDNGGLQYLFEMTYPRRPPYTAFVDAYAAIGAAAEADALRCAVALFPVPNPHRYVGKRNRFLDSFKDRDGDAVNSPFEPYTRRLCGNAEVWRLLDAYIAARPEAFPAVPDVQE